MFESDVTFGRYVDQVTYAQTKAKNTDTDLYDDGLDEELAVIMTAINIVSQHLAKKLFDL